MAAEGRITVWNQQWLPHTYVMGMIGSGHTILWVREETTGHPDETLFIPLPPLSTDAFASLRSLMPSLKTVRGEIHQVTGRDRVMFALLDKAEP